MFLISLDGARIVSSNLEAELDIVRPMTEADLDEVGGGSDAVCACYTNACGGDACGSDICIGNWCSPNGCGLNACTGNACLPQLCGVDICPTSNIGVIGREFDSRY